MYKKMENPKVENWSYNKYEFENVFSVDYCALSKERF